MTITAEEKAQRAQQFLTGLLASVPEAQREQAQAVFTTLGGAEAAAEHIAAHILRQEDYSRAMNEATEAKTKAAGESEALIGTLQEERTRLNEWWKVNEPVLKQAKTLMDAGKWPGDTTLPATPTTPTPAPGDPTPAPVSPTAAVTTADLDKARTFASAVGFEVRDALMQQKLASAEVVMQAYADSVGLPFIQLSETPLSDDLIAKLPATLARLHSCVPVMIDEGQLLVASPNLLSPQVEEELRLRLDMPVRSLICTPSEINDVINDKYPREVASAELAGKPVVRRSDDDEENESWWDKLKSRLSR